VLRQGLAFRSASLQDNFREGIHRNRSPSPSMKTVLWHLKRIKKGLKKKGIKKRIQKDQAAIIAATICPYQPPRTSPNLQNLKTTSTCTSQERLLSATNLL
jgi:hypothetical protein